MPEDVSQYFAEPPQPPASPGGIVYRPALLGIGKLYFSKSTAGVDLSDSRTFIVMPSDGPMPEDVWSTAQRMDSLPPLVDHPPPEFRCARLPAEMQRRQSFAEWERRFQDFLYREQQLVVFRCRELQETSRPHESRGDFRVRVQQLAAERRDMEAEKLRQKYAEKFQTLNDRIERARQSVARETDQYKQQRWDTVFRAGSTILGALFSRKKLSKTNFGKASTTLRTAGRAASEKGDVDRAEDKLESLQEKQAQLQSEFDAELAALGNKLDAQSFELEEIRIRALKKDISVQRFGVVWLPLPGDRTR